MKNYWTLRKIDEMMLSLCDSTTEFPLKRGKNQFQIDRFYKTPSSLTIQGRKVYDVNNQLSNFNEELAFKIEEKEKLSVDLLSAHKEISVQNDEINKQKVKLINSSVERVFQDGKITKQAEELKVANQEIAEQRKDKKERADELVIAQVELSFQDEEKVKRAQELAIVNEELADQKKEIETQAEELIIADKELLFQMNEKKKRATELLLANEELAYQNLEKEKRSLELAIANEELLIQNKEKEDRAKELAIANHALMFQNKEKEKRAGELILANIELAYQNNEKENRAAELIVANQELAVQNIEKERRAKELVIANEELSYQNKEKEKRAKELVVANQELIYQNKEKEKRAAELILANIELAYENVEKENRASELIVANKELEYQNSEKEKRAKELVIANEELKFQNKEKEKRAAELSLANIELAYQNKEKENRAEELIVANIELAFQNSEKDLRAQELVVANKELAFQNKEKEKRAAELIIANKELAFQNKEKEKLVTKSIFLSNHDHLTGLNNRRFYEDELVKLDLPENLPITIIMGDINGLKMINDSFGHIAGDMLLKVIAKIIKNISRPGDLVARIGGDEFVLVLPKTNDSEAEKIVSQIKSKLMNDSSNQLKITASFGHETKTKPSEDIQELFQNAENHMYRHKLSETSSMRSQTIDLIMHTLFAKNPREAIHSERVGLLCEKIATFLNLGESIIHDVRIAGMMHDIGKIGIEESILNKNGKLSDDEWKQIKKHPEIGYRILSTTQELTMIADFIYQHHERWNGTGYPKGLQSDNILLQARIIAIADSFEAMTSERTYREKLTYEKALEEIQRCSGTLYDPTIVKVFAERFADLAS